ncbi:MAG: SLC13 family permease [Candidatus Aenigmatarchaeota archaeon]
MEHAFSLFFVACAFLVMIFFILRPRKVSLPFIGRTVTMDYAFGSVLGALILLLSGTLTSGEAVSSLLGRPGFEPGMMIILFMSIAYIAISLDSTGFFEYLAIKIVMRSGGDGRRLFFYFYFLSGFITLFTSNDIVILTLTPIIFYFGKHAKIRVFPYLIAEFFAANIWSMFLYIGNPTNIIAASASGIGIIEYSAWMILPTMAAGFSCLGLLYLIFRKSVNVRFRVPVELNAAKFLKDRTSAFVTFCFMCGTLVTLFLSPFLGIEMWAVALLFAIGLLSYDTVVAFDENRKEHRKYYRTFKRHVRHETTKIYEFRLHFIADHVPWRIVPFLLCSFVMVESLVATGVTDAAAGLFSAVSGNALSAAIAMGFASAFAANLVNNRPMTVLFTKITESGSFGLSGSIGLASIFALIIGSNLGANITLIGALAGIMWANILKGEGQTISYRKFAKTGLMVTPVVLLIACAVLGLQFMLFG